jgi:hypothetical protein
MDRSLRRNGSSGWAGISWELPLGMQGAAHEPLRANNKRSRPAIPTLAGNLSCSSIFTFTKIRPSLLSMTNFWFSATYYVFLGYNRRRLQSRVQ